MSSKHRTQNLRNITPSQSMGQDGRDNSFTTGQASKDSLTGKNQVKEYVTKGPPKTHTGGLNSNS